MKRKLLALSMAFIAAFAVFVANPNSASAAFNQNRIMSDSVFNNSGSMGAVQIDNLLNSFPNSCISLNRGFVSPNVVGYNPSQGFLYGSNVSAGVVIASAAQAYDINPQVILATLQKEQSLVTGSAGCHYETPPTQTCTGSDRPYGTNSSCVTACQYAGGCVYIAMGYDCPYYCVPNSTGFSKQVIKAAWKLKFVQQRSLGNFNWNVQKPGWDNSDDPQTSYDGYMTQGTLKRNPSSSYVSYDGYRPVNSNALSVHLDTGATAALYSYTPFTSGNTNFVNIFEGWFGSTQGVSYAWGYVGQYAYTDETQSTAVDLSNATRGQRVYLVVRARNDGGSTWTNSGANPVRIGTSRPQNRDSVFCDNTWLSCGRPATLKEASVAPGETGTFEFWYNIPAGGGSYNEYFNLLAEGYVWMNDLGLYFPTYAPVPTYTWQLTNQYAYTDQNKTTPADLTSLTPGQRVYIGYQARNTGNVTWTNSGPNAVKTGTNSPQDRNSSFCDDTWLSCSRPGAMIESSVAPGAIGTFEFWYRAPGGAGQYQERFRPVAEGIAWMNDVGLSYYSQVRIPLSNPGASDRITNSQQLVPGESINSPNGRYQLILQGDGNVVLYSPFRALWSSGTPGTNASRLTMQDDGNLVLYAASGQALWNTRTQGRGGARLTVQDDGNLVLYAANGQPLWYTRTNGQQ